MNAIAKPKDKTPKLIPIICSNPYEVGKNEVFAIILVSHQK